MNKVRRDVVLNELRQGHVRLALTVLFMPAQYYLLRRCETPPPVRVWVDGVPYPAECHAQIRRPEEA